MGPRAGLDGCEKSRPHRDSIPGPSSPWPSLEDSFKMDLRWDKMSDSFYVD